MADRPFHHGNLRAELLDSAARTLRRDGVEALSLRQLAREAGVSHAAPRRHFPDRQALLDALAEQGFRRLTGILQAARSSADDDARRTFRAAARAYVDFAATEPALVEVMFSTKNGAAAPAVQEAAGGFFAVVEQVVADGTPAGGFPLAGPARLQMLLVATLQGIAGLVAAGRLSPEQVDELLDDTVVLFGAAGPTAK